MDVDQDQDSLEADGLLAFIVDLLTLPASGGIKITASEVQCSTRLRKAIPVYSGDDHGAKQIDKWVKEFRGHPEFGYIFNENARDVLNKQNPESVKKTLAYLASLVV